MKYLVRKGRTNIESVLTLQEIKEDIMSLLNNKKLGMKTRECLSNINHLLDKII
jgi:hypothetical protein